MDVDPPQSTDTEMLPPLPPLPPVPPSFLTEDVNPGQQKTMDASKLAWTEKTSLMAKLVNIDKEIADLSERHESIQKIINSSLFASKPPSWSGRLDAIQAQRDDAVRRKEEMLKRLKQLDTRSTTAELEAGEFKDSSLELADLLIQLKNTVKELDGLMAHSRSLATNADDRFNAKDQIPQATIDEIEDAISDLENILQGFQNELQVHDDILAQRVHWEVDDQITALKTEMDQALRLPEGSTERIEKLEKDFSEAKEAFDEAVDRNAVVANQLGTAQEQNNQILKEIETMQNKLAELENAREQDLKEIAALQAAVDLYRTNRPVTLSGQHEQYLMSTLEQPFTQTVLNNIQQSITELRNQLSDLLSNRDNALYDNLWEKLKATYQAIHAIQTRLEVGEQDV